MKLDDLLTSPRLIEIPVIHNPPGVYFLVKDGEIVYIGASKNPVSRVEEHRKGYSSQGNVKDFNKAYLLPVSDDHPLTVIEKEFILRMRPKLNVRYVRSEEPVSDVLLGFVFP